MSHPLLPKKEVALALLERSSVHVHLDPRAAGVVVPLFLKSQPQLVLQVGLNMPVPIPDLRIDEAGMTCTLSFNRSPFYCVIPWTSVFAMIGDDGRVMIWKDDVPREVAKPSQARPDRPASAPSEISERPMRIAPSEEERARARVARDGRDGTSTSAGSSTSKDAGAARASIPGKSGSAEPRKERGGANGRGGLIAVVPSSKKPRKRSERTAVVGKSEAHASDKASRSRGAGDARGGLVAVPSGSGAAPGASKKPREDREQDGKAGAEIVPPARDTSGERERTRTGQRDRDGGQDASRDPGP